MTKIVMPDSKPVALIAGVTGIAGSNLAEHLLSLGWTVYGLARNPRRDTAVRPIAADLQSLGSLAAALTGVNPTHVFITTWLRQPSEAENIRVNKAMVRNLLTALDGSAGVKHVALVTGLKHYLGPFESYGTSKPASPFYEDSPRLPYPNFYYDQEDEVYAAAPRLGYTWSIHRPHTMIGYALGNAMNMGVTLAVYASLCKALGRPFIFPGSRVQWDGLTDVTDARILARHLEWASTSDAGRNRAFNIVNGDVFRWSWLWPKLAAHFGLEAAAYPAEKTPLEKQMANDAPAWAKLATEQKLAQPDLTKLISAWHTDGDLGREIECVTDMTRSRLAGFCDYQPTLASFTDLFDRLKRDRIIP